LVLLKDQVLTREVSSLARSSEGNFPWPIGIGSGGKFKLSPIGVEGAVDLFNLDLSQSELVRVEAPPTCFWKSNHRQMTM
jgi:hypothetical protein